MLEGSLAVDPFIALRLQQISLNSAQEMVVKTANEKLDDELEGKLRHEHAVELLKHQILDANGTKQKSIYGTKQKSSSAHVKARQHIENLDIIQKAEKEEHAEMLSTIEQWRAALWKKPNKEEENEMH